MEGIGTWLTIFAWLFIAGCIFAVLGMVAKSWNERKAKRDARRMLAKGRIDSRSDYRTAYNTLAKIPDDLEAKDLWEKLRDLKIKEAK